MGKNPGVKWHWGPQKLCVACWTWSKWEKNSANMNKIQVFRADKVVWIEYGDDGDKLATYCDNNLAQDWKLCTCSRCGDTQRWLQGRLLTTNQAVNLIQNRKEKAQLSCLWVTERQNSAHTKQITSQSNWLTSTQILCGQQVRMCMEQDRFTENNSYILTKDVVCCISSHDLLAEGYCAQVAQGKIQISSRNIACRALLKEHHMLS